MQLPVVGSARSFRVCAAYLLLWSAATAGRASDWPTYNGDNRRSGVSNQPLPLPLDTAWVHRAAHPPDPAWPDPAKHDYWHRKYNLNPRVIYDRAYHAVSAGQLLFYGTSSDDSVVCLDAQTGSIRWVFYTEGPIRLAPTINDDRVYVGSDDGCVYCLLADDGSLQWKFRPGPGGSRCLGNGRMISRWPVRSGIVVEEGVAYCAAGLFPTSEGAFVCALDAASGELVYRERIGQSTQGYMAVASDRLLLPTGRTAPGVFDRQTGRFLGDIASSGGNFALVAGDALAAGSGDGDGVLSLSDTETLEGFVSFDGLHLIAQGDRFFVHSRDSLAALDRPRYVAAARQLSANKSRREKLKKQNNEASKAELSRLGQEIVRFEAEMKASWLWRTPCRNPFSVVLAGATLFAGGDGAVAAYDVHDGQQLWSMTVEGRVYGLAIADGDLVVSTSSGLIYCLRPRTNSTDADGDAPTATASPPAGQDPAQVDNPYPSDGHTDTYARAAEAIVSAAGTDRGYCLVVDARSGRLAYELAKRSQLRVIGVEPDADKVAEARRRLSTCGMYGTRVVMHCGPADTLRDYPPYFANLIASDAALAEGRLPEFQADLLRALRPCGGVIALAIPDSASARARQWLTSIADDGFTVQTFDGDLLKGIVRRERLPGAGSWTHGLADPGNTACTMDQLVTGPVAVQWFGAPGPRPMTDRHHRNVTPLYNDGRLFVPGENLVIAVDAYNGSVLWQREIANSLRLGAFLDCSNMVLDDRALYIAAEDACHVLDVARGEEAATLTVPQLVPDQKRHWGYVARAGTLLVGSGRKPHASYREQSYEADAVLWNDRMSLVTSDYIFAMDPETGKTAWTYRSGAVLNTTITIGGGRVYFVESHSPQTATVKTGRTPMKTFLEGPNYLVALELDSGRVFWRQEADLTDCRLIAYLNYAQEKLVLSGNKYIDSRLWYYFSALDAVTGETVWRQSHNSGYSPGGEHGEQNRHPTIVGDVVYTYPLAYHLQTGKQVEGWAFSRRGHGCGNISASAGSIFWRGGNPWRRDLGQGGQASRINSVNRPGCWINIIPAGGLLMIPEASSGCTCSFPLQTSITYAPVQHSGE